MTGLRVREEEEGHFIAEHGSRLARIQIQKWGWAGGRMVLSSEDN